MTKSPPNWTQLIQPEIIKDFWAKPEVKMILDKAQENYVTWDVFRHYTFPSGLKADVAWALLKITHRLGGEYSQVLDKIGRPFVYNLTKGLYRRLAHIDTHASGMLNIITTQTTSAQRDKLIMSTLTEEAIASSQIEGANTSRKVAKEMIYTGRKARTIGEQMIINNYQVMQLVTELKDIELSKEMLLDIQQRITNKTLEYPDQAGRFRRDDDLIVVLDKMTGEIAHEPPKEADMLKELDRLITFANVENQSDNAFIHPFIKATILHFWLAYLHPFADGNGRTARAIFYWYLMKRGYWLFEYLSISRIIKKAKKKYDQAFLNTETDENDLTYFLLHSAEVACQAINEMEVHLQRKLKEDEKLRAAADKLEKFNPRQVAVLEYFRTHPDKMTNITYHKTVHGVVYETARNDLMDLANKGLLVETMKGKKKIFLPNRQAIKKIF